MTEPKQYQMVYICSNCLERVYVLLPYGKPAPMKPDAICKYCGCNTFSHAFHPDSPKLKISAG